MNGVHDLGGMHGFGPVVPDRDAPVFHADWERRIAAILACTAFNGLSVFDENRRTAERMPPVDYLATPYFGRWLYMIENLAVEKGLATREEVAQGQLVPGGAVWSGNRIPAGKLAALFHRGGSARVELAAAPRFAVGDQVTVRQMNPDGHTRLPRYARGRRGVVQIHHGGFVFADTRAHGLGDCPQHLYNVRFAARELWGEQAPAQDAVYLDLWDSYLE